MKKTWLITGCSRGFGKLLAEKVAERGDNVVATARGENALQDLATRFPDNVRITALDVTQTGAAMSAVQLAEDVFGGLDVLVNNAGHGFVGAIERPHPKSIDRCSKSMCLD